jgi:mRNA degradation ribonuclease J1/J2
LDATIEQTVDMYLILEGLAGAKWKHEWYPVNLQDQAIVSATRLQNAQAFAAEIANQFYLRDAGFVTNDDVLNFLIGSGEIIEEDVKRVGREKILRDVEDKYSKKQIEKWAKIIAE